MAKAKYKLYADGYYRTRAWDGTYNPDGSKHRINLKSKKSSKDLEQKVNELKMQIAEQSYIKPTDITFCEYADQWLTLYNCLLYTSPSSGHCFSLVEALAVPLAPPAAVFPAPPEVEGPPSKSAFSPRPRASLL